MLLQQKAPRKTDTEQPVREQVKHLLACKCARSRQPRRAGRWSLTHESHRTLRQDIRARAACLDTVDRSWQSAYANSGTCNTRFTLTVCTHLFSCQLRWHASSVAAAGGPACPTGPCPGNTNAEQQQLSGHLTTAGRRSWTRSAVPCSPGA